MDPKMKKITIIPLPDPKAIASKLDSQKDDEDMPEEGDDDERYKAAAQDVMDAMKSDDVDGFAEALKNFFDVCRG